MECRLSEFVSVSPLGGRWEVCVQAGAAREKSEEVIGSLITDDFIIVQCFMSASPRKKHQL